MWKKLTAFVLALGTCAALAAPVSAARAKAAETEKFADVYILAGQSNAVGHGLLSQKVKNQTDDTYTYGRMIAAADPRNTSGYENVLYYGATDVHLDSTVPDSNIVTVKTGLGGSSEKIGPELGMANVLSQTATADRPAVIIKYAAGGTTIGDYRGTFSEIGLTSWFGNWASPTILNRWADMGRRNTKFNSVMYNRMLEFLDNGFAKLAKLGYTPVLKSYIWMQGESDSDLKILAEEYEQNLEDFINDLREAVAQKTDNPDDSNTPFVIGKISSHYNNGGKNVKVVREAQDKVAKLLPYCYTVETEDFPLLDGKTQTVVGTDICHFNAGDQYELGKRFAKTALANIAPYSFSVTSSKGGEADARNFHSEGEFVRIPFTAEDGFELAGVTLNGAPVGYSVEDGAVVLKIDDSVLRYNDVYLEFERGTVYDEGISFIQDVVTAMENTTAGRGVIAASEAFMTVILFSLMFNN